MVAIAASILAAGPVAIAAAGLVAIAAAAIAAGRAVVGIVVVARLRRRGDREREQCGDRCDEQCQSAAYWRAERSRTAHCSLQMRESRRAMIVAKKSTKVRPVARATKATRALSLFPRGDAA